MKASPPATLPVKTFLPMAIFLMGIGWSGIAAVILYTSPNGGTRWLLFFLGVLALTGTFLPVIAFLNRRFPSTPPATAAVILREALFAGVYVPFLGWMQIGRVLTPSLALLLAIGLVLIEWLLRVREGSQREQKPTP